MCTKNRTPLSPASGTKAPLTGDDGMMTGRDATRRDRSGHAAAAAAAGAGVGTRGCGTAGVFRETLCGGFPGVG